MPSAEFTAGKLKKDKTLVLINDNRPKNYRQSRKHSRQSWFKKIEVDEAFAGDIIDITGFPTVAIGDTIADVYQPEAVTQNSP